MRSNTKPLNGIRDIEILSSVIIDLWNKRLAAIMSLLKEVAKLIIDCTDEQEKIVSSISSNFGNIGCLRKNNFNGLLEGILNHRERIKKEAMDAIDGFLTEEGRMVDDMADILSKALIGDGAGYLAAVTVTAEVMPSCQERENKLANILMKFKGECTQMNSAMKKLASRGEKLKTKDFKKIAYSPNIIYSKKATVIEAMNDIGRIRQELFAQWQRISDVVRI